MKFLILITFLLAYSITQSQDVRNVRDDVGYCWSLDQMDKLVKYLQEKETKVVEKNIVAAISPHDDYLYAGKVYFPLFKSLRIKEAVIFGVTHGTVRKEIGDTQNILLFDNFKEWVGPRKNIAISQLREFIKSKLDTSYFKVNNKAHELEHSIEGLLPFLQYFNPDIKITPIMVTAMSFERIDEISDKLSDIMVDYIKEKKIVLGNDIIFLMSSDANHYGKDFNNISFGEDSIAHLKATEKDKEIANNYLSETVTKTKLEEFTNEMKNVVWCGKYSVPFGLSLASKVVKKLKGNYLYGRILRYSDTFTEGVLPVKGTELGTTAPFSLKHWCGFLSSAYFIK